MKKFVFAIFTLVAVGLFTNPLFAKYFSNVPECASSCNFMQSCHVYNDSYDIYNCAGSYVAGTSRNNCRWDVEMKGGKFYVDGKECKPD